MANNNLKQTEELEYIGDDFNFDRMEGILSQKLEKEFSDLNFLEEERKKIGNSDNLGKIVGEVAWEQLMNNVATIAGEDFIKDNGNMKLDLRAEAHIQTTENFAVGKIATHNKEIDYQKRHDDWQSNFQKDENGNTKYHGDRTTKQTGKQKETLTSDARKKYDKDRPTGSKDKGTDMDHTVSAAEIIRDREVATHLTEQEKIDFANSSSNLNEMNSSHNRSKSDLSMEEWLNLPNAKGQKPKDNFNDLDDEKIKEYYEKDKEARKKYDEKKKQGEKKSQNKGKQSRKKEAFRISKKALRAVVMQLLAEFVKEIIRKLIMWLKSPKKNLNRLLEKIKSAIQNFVGNLKKHLVNAGTTLITTVTTAIFGPIVKTIKSAIIMIKQGVKTLGEVISHLKKPENKEKSLDILLLEIGKMFVTGVSAVGAIGLSEVIEKGLMTIPVFAINIPLLGSLASLLGILIGGIVAGIVGAIVLSFIDKLIVKKLKEKNDRDKINKRNEILNIQKAQSAVVENRVLKTKENTFSEIEKRHIKANEIIQEVLNNTMDTASKKQSISENQSDLQKIQQDLENLL